MKNVIELAAAAGSADFDPPTIERKRQNANIRQNFNWYVIYTMVAKSQTKTS